MGKVGGVTLKTNKFYGPIKVLGILGVTLFCELIVFWFFFFFFFFFSFNSSISAVHQFNAI